MSLSLVRTLPIAYFLKLMIQWTEWMMNFEWQLRGVFVKTNLQSNTKLVRKNLFSEIKQKLIFSYQLFKEVQNHFHLFCILDCAVEKNVSFSRRNRN